VSTLFLSLVGALFLYFILKFLEADEPSALMGALVLVFNPLYFNLSQTFMTDVPYLAMLLASLYFYLRGRGAGGDGFLLAGSVFAGLAFLVRQIGLLIPASVILCLLAEKSLNPRRAALTCAVPALCLACYWYWLNYIHGLPWVHQTGGAFDISVKNFYPALAGSMFYCGFFGLPFALAFLFLRGKKPSAGWTARLAAAGIIARLAVNMLHSGFMPYLENVIQRHGLGTITVAGAAAKSSGSFLTGPAFWAILTFVCAAGFIVFLWNIFRLDFKEPLVLAAAVCLLQFLSSLLRGHFFDRYLLSLLPFMVISGVLMLRSAAGRRTYGGLLFGIILLALYSGLGTGDYLNWNLAKWDAGRKAMAMGYKPEEIANGFDWDGYFTFKDNMDRLKALKPAKNITTWEWQSLNPYKVYMSFSREDTGRELLDMVSYRDIFTGKDALIYIYKL
jgi:4-amino-4-deoxy-L-arabinose transferase-like glycosyltransferase